MIFTLPTTLPPALTTYISTTLPSMGGWCSPTKATALATHVLTHRPTACLEIGVFSGRSLYAIGLALAHNRHGTLIGIDPWDPVASVAGFESDPANRDWWARCDHSAIYRECDGYLQSLALTSTVSLFRGTSAEALPLLRIACGNRPFLDVLHIDGNHSEASALYDVEAYVPLVVPGGCVIFDDINWDSTKRAQARLSTFCDQTAIVGNDKEGMCAFYRRKGGDTP